MGIIIYIKMSKIQCPPTYCYTFQSTKIYPSGLTNDVCRFCFKWCAVEGVHTKKYWMLNDRWERRNPESLELYDPNISQSVLICIPICSCCFGRNKGEYESNHQISVRKTIDILGEKFFIDHYSRVNNYSKIIVSF
jgi:hypothetical protein